MCNLKFFFSLILLNHFFLCMIFFIVVLLNKTFILINNVIKCNRIYDICFEIKYSYLYLSHNFLFYYLVKYHLIFI